MLAMKIKRVNLCQNIVKTLSTYWKHVTYWNIKTLIDNVENVLLYIFLWTCYS